MTKITNFVWNSVDDCIISELDATGAVQAVYTNEPRHYGGVLSQIQGTTTSTCHADALGSTRLMSSSSEMVTDEYLHDAWGHSLLNSGTTVNPFRWVGRHGYYYSASTGVLYVRARNYLPQLARWGSVDPMLFFGGTNHYTYVLNSPAQWVDPSGLFCRPPEPQQYCGPEVKHWFAEELCALVSLLKAENFVFSDQPYRHFFRQLKYERAGLTDDSRCPTGVCEDSVQLCNTCIDITELGNIALGVGASVAFFPTILKLKLGVIFDYGAIALFGGFWAQVDDPTGTTRGFDKTEEISAVLAGIKLNRLLLKHGCPLTSDTLCRALSERPAFESYDVQKLIQDLRKVDEAVGQYNLSFTYSVLDQWSKKRNVSWRLAIEAASGVNGSPKSLLKSLQVGKYATCHPCTFDMSEFLATRKHVSIANGAPHW